MRRVTKAFLFVLLTVGLDLAAQDSSWISTQRVNQIVQRVRASLPDGWSVTEPVMNRTPEDWHSRDNRGFEVKVENREQFFRIWVLPKDWVGIRQVRKSRPRFTHEVFGDADHKMIVDVQQPFMADPRYALSRSSPSLVNGGWGEAQTVFGSRLDEINRETKALVDDFCNDQPCRDEAAHSLIVLGVPSQAVTLDCAEHARGEAQEFCAHVLAYATGRESLRVLQRVVSDPKTSGPVQKAAAMALGGSAGPESGPALLTALRNATWAEATHQIVEALGAAHYDAAAPEIASRFERDAQVYYAKALASLRYQPAIPLIERLVKSREFTSDWLLRETSYLGNVPEIALMRLTASWGQPSDGIRLLLLPPSTSGTGLPAQVAAVIENVSDRDQLILAKFAFGDVIVDGKEYSFPGTYDGRASLGINEVSARAINLPDVVFDGTVHRISYRVGSAVSNSLTVQFAPRQR